VSLRRGELIDYAEPLEDERMDQKKAVEAAEKIKEYIVNKGYLDTQVAVNFKDLSKTEVAVEFIINEGSKTQIGSIIIKSENKTINSQLTRVLARFRKRPFNNQTLQDLETFAQEFLKSEKYILAKLEQESLSYTQQKKLVALVYKLSDPIQYQILFAGNQYYSASDLLRALEVSNLEQSLVEPASELPQKLKTFYLLNGFAHVRIDTNENFDAKNHFKTIKINVSEGPRVSLKNYVISGRISRKPKYYEEIINSNSDSTIEAGWYFKEGLDIGYRNLITELNNQGFLRARIISSRAEYSKDKARATLFLTIDEGPRTKISAVKFAGANSIARKDLLEALGLKDFEDLRLIDLEKGIQEIKLLYGKRGHLEMRILNEEQENLVQYSNDGSTATVFLDIYEGTPIKVASIVIEGNDKTKDSVILRSLEFERGDLLTIDKFNDSILQLNRTGLFSRLDIRSLELGTASSERTIIVTVIERNPGLVRFGIGVNNERGFTVRGFTSVSYNNLGGTGRALTGRVELQEDIDDLQELEQKYSINYLEPHLLNTKTKGRFNYTYSKEVTETNPKVIGESQRADLLLERDLSRHTKLTWTFWGIESFEEFRDDGSDNVLQRVAYVGPTLDIDYRDNVFMPTKGHYLRFTSLYSSPGLGSSDGIQFIKNDASYTFYVPLGSPKWIFAQALRGGHLMNLDPIGAVPARYAFFLGGHSTIRGFGGREDLETIPNEVELPTGSSDLTPLISTESSYYLIKSEIRFPIYDPLGGVVFYDGGQVSVLGYDFDNPFRQSFGVGLRINTPVGPVVLDYARKIDPRCFGTGSAKQCERTDRIHFSVGSY
jgi:outer membrane protein insertion porin family